MILPFVSRQHYNAVVRMQDATIERLSVELQSITARYHQLRVQGFTEPKPALAPYAAPVVDPVDTAIARMSGGNRMLSEQMRRQVVIDEAEGMSREQIAQRIYGGTPTTNRADL